MANQLNDYLISPTNYMTAFLRQRGWVLPESTVTIPNIIPEVEESTAQARSYVITADLDRDCYKSRQAPAYVKQF